MTAAREQASAGVYEGRCHCGAIGFVYRTTSRPDEWQVRACQCSFCRSRAAMSVSDPAGSLRFVEHIPSMLHRYRFARETTDFLVCRICGTYIGAMTVSENGAFGIVNARVLQAILDCLPAPVPMNYDDEDPAGRQARRERRWTPVSDATRAGCLASA